MRELGSMTDRDQCLLTLPTTSQKHAKKPGQGGGRAARTQGAGAWASAPSLAPSRPHLQQGLSSTDLRALPAPQAPSSSGSE